MPQHIVPCPDNTYRSVCLRHCIPPPGPEVDINTWTIIGPQNQLTPALGSLAPCGSCIQIDGRAPTQQDVGKWIVGAIEHDWNGDPVSHPIFGTGPIPLYSGLNTWQTGTVSTHYYTRARIDSVQPATGTWAGHTSPGGNWILEPGITGCGPPVVFWDDSWNCKIDKFNNVACVDPNNGTGVHSTLQDCIDNCESTQISPNSFLDYLGDVIKPWIDPEGGGCLSDIKTCPCGWDYVPDYTPPTVTATGVALGTLGHPPLYAQYAGTSVCLSPDYALWVSKIGIIDPSWGPTGGTFAGLQAPFSLPCAEMQGVFNPTIGMTIQENPTSGMGNFLAGSITNVIANTPSTTYTWDKHVIVEIDPAYNSSIINPNQMVIQSTPCASLTEPTTDEVTLKYNL